MTGTRKSPRPTPPSAQPPQSTTQEAEAETRQAKPTEAEAHPAQTNDANPRPKKKYKSSTFADASASPRKPVRGKQQPNTVSADQYKWLLWVVDTYDTKKQSGKKNDAKLYTELKRKLSHLDTNVLRNQIKQARKRIQLKKTKTRERYEKELAARDAQVAKANARDQEAAVLAAECDRLKAEVEARDAAAAESKRELDALQKQIADTAAPDQGAAIADLQAKIQVLDDQVKRQKELRKEQERKVKKLKQKISSDTVAESELDAAKKKLAKTEAANEVLSKAFGPQKKDLDRLKLQLAQASEDSAVQERQHRIRLEDLQLRARRAEEERDEAEKSLDLFNRAAKVERALKTLRLAAKVIYGSRRDLNRRVKESLKDDTLWNNATMTELALEIIGVTGADRLLMERLRKQFYSWRQMRNEISHTPEAYKKYLSEAESLMKDMEEVCRFVTEATQKVSDTGVSCEALEKAVQNAAAGKRNHV